MKHVEIEIPLLVHVILNVVADVHRDKVVVIPMSVTACVNFRLKHWNVWIYSVHVIMLLVRYGAVNPYHPTFRVDDRVENKGLIVGVKRTSDSELLPRGNHPIYVLSILIRLGPRRVKVFYLNNNDITSIVYHLLP